GDSSPAMFAADQPLTFAKSTGTGITALYLNGGAVSTATANVSTTNGITTIAAGVTVSSDGSINFNTPSLTNSGVIQAPSGSIQIANLSGNTLSVNNSLGLIIARDEVLFQTLGSTPQSKAELAVMGGIISANTVSFVSPQGRINVAVTRINGSV